MVNVSMVNFVSSEVIADGTDTLAGVLPRILIDVSTALPPDTVVTKDFEDMRSG